MNQKNNIKFWNLRTIRNRFILNFILLIFFVIILFVIDNLGSQSTSKKAQYLSFNLSASQDELHKLNSEIIYSNLLLQNYLYAPFKEFYAKQRKEKWKVNIKDLLNTLQNFRTNWTDIEQKQEYDKLLDKIAKLQALQNDLEKDISKERTFSLENTNLNIRKSENNSRFFTNEILPKIEDIGDNILKLSNLIDKEINQTLEDISSIQNFYGWLWYITALILFILGYLLVNRQVSIIQKSIHKVKEQLTILQNGDIPVIKGKYKDDFKEIDNEIQEIAQEMKKIQILAHEVGERHFETELVIFDNKGDVGQAIAEMRNSLNELAAQDKISTWVNEGLNIFNSIIRETNETQILYDNISKEFVKYLQANYGSIFIINDDNPNDIFLELKSVYAFDRKRYIEKQIRLGQSLVGQSWKEKDVIYQEEIPKDYISVKTGLGEATPESLLIVPLIANDEIMGVIEIASFKKIKDYQIDFAKQVANNIVSTIFSLKNGERTQKLLKEAQSTTEKMKKQEEVSARNMDELVKMQENMQKNDVKLKAQTTAINNYLATLELDLNGYILEANPIFLDIFRYNFEEIKEQSYDIFILNTDRNTQDYQLFWEQLQRGKTRKGEFRLMNKHSKEIWLNASFTPIKDEFGKYKKVLMLAIDITKPKKLNIDYIGQIESLNKSQAIIDFDINGRINYANDIFLKLLKYDLEDILGKHHSVLLSEKNKNSEFYANFWKKLSNGEFINGRFQYVAKDNTEIWVRGSYNPIKNTDEEVHKIIQFAQFVGEEKRLEEQMTKTNDRLRKQNLKIKEQNQETQEKVKELTSEREKSRNIQAELKGETEAINRTLASISYNEYGFILDANDDFLKIMEYELEELNGEHHSLFVSQQDKESNLQKQLWIDLRIGKPQYKEDKYISKSGKEVWLKTSYTPITDERGKIIKVLQLAINLTQEKDFITSYREERKALIFSVGMVEFDIYGTITQINNIYLSMLGYTSTDEVIGKHHALFVDKEDKNKEEYYFFWEKLRKGEVIKDTFLRIQKNGTNIFIESTYNPILDYNGNVSKIICLATKTTNHV